MSTEEEINLKEIIVVLVSKWKVIAATAICVAVVTGLINFFVLSPQFETTGILLITAGPKYKMEPQIITPQVSQSTLVEKIKIIFNNRMVAAKVREKLKAVVPEEEYTQLTSLKLISLVKISLNATAGRSKGGDTIIEVNLTYNNPRICFSIAEAWLEAVWEEVKKLDNGYIDEISGYLSGQLLDIEESLRGLETSQMELEKKYLIEELKERIIELSSTKTELEIKRSTTMMKIKAQEEKVTFLDESLSSLETPLVTGEHDSSFQTLVEAYSTLHVDENALIEELISRLEKQIKEVKKKHLAQGLERLKSKLMALISDKKKKAVEFNARTPGDVYYLITIARASLMEFRGMLSSLDQGIGNINNELEITRKVFAEKNKEFKELLRKVSLKKTTYKVVSKKLEETMLHKSLLVNPIKILQKPFLPDFPVRPRKIMNTLLSFFLSSIVLSVIFLIFNLLLKPIKYA